MALSSFIYNQNQSEKLINDIEKLLCSTCVSIIPNVRSIYLYGSLGKNELAFEFGDVSLDKIYNDLDIILVVYEQPSIEQKQHIYKTLKNLFTVRWLDISYVKKSKLLLRPRNTVLFHDLINASRCIYGENFLQDCRPWAISIEKEVSTLFSTRFFCLYGVLDYSGHKLQLTNDKVFLHNQLAKGMFAIIQAKALSHGKYFSTYQENYSWFLENYNSSNELLDLREIELLCLGKFCPGKSSEQISITMFASYLMFYQQTFSKILTGNISTFSDTLSRSRFTGEHSFRLLLSRFTKNYVYLKKLSLQSKEAKIADALVQHFHGREEISSLLEPDVLSEVRAERING